MSYVYLISLPVYLTPALIALLPPLSSLQQLSPSPAKGSTWSGFVTTVGGCLASWTKSTVTTLSSWWREPRPQRRLRRAWTRPKNTYRGSRTEPSSTACKPHHVYLSMFVCYLTSVNKMSELVIASCGAPQRASTVPLPPPSIQKQP